MSKEKNIGIQPTPFEVAIGNLSDSENPQPIRPEMIDVTGLRRGFVEAGFNMEITEIQKGRLRLKQFRNYEERKGAVVVAIIGVGNEDILENKLLELSAGWPRIKNSKTGLPVEGSKSRGLRQLVAKLFAVSLGVISPDEFCESVNRSVWKGLMRGKGDEDVIRLAGIFTGIDKPEGKTTSIPTGSPEKVFDFLMNGLKG